MTLKFWSSCLYLSSSKITGLWHHTKIFLSWRSNPRFCVCHANFTSTELPATITLSLQSTFKKKYRYTNVNLVNLDICMESGDKSVKSSCWHSSDLSLTPRVTALWPLYDWRFYVPKCLSSTSSLPTAHHILNPLHRSPPCHQAYRRFDTLQWFEWTFCLFKSQNKKWI